MLGLDSTVEIASHNPVFSEEKGVFGEIFSISFFCGEAAKKQGKG